MSVVTVTATLEASNVPPRVRLDVVDNGSPYYFATTVTRLNPDGTTSAVRTQDGNPLQLVTSGSNRTGLLYDYEAPFGYAVSYSTMETPGTVSASVTVPETNVWLIHPGIPSLSMPVTLAPGTLQQTVYPVHQGVFYPMGRTNPVVQTDGARKGGQSSLVVITQSLSEAASVRDLVADAGILLLNVPPDPGTGVDAQYIAVADVTISRGTDTGIDGLRIVSMPFVVVDRPAGGSQSQRTLADLFVYPNLAALMTAYPTFADLLAGP